MLMVFGDINEARRQLALANNGYVFANTMPDDVLVGFEQLVDLGEAQVRTARDHTGEYTTQYVLTDKFDRNGSY